MTNLFISLFNMSITASWLVLAVVVLRFLLKKAPKWINAVLWAFVGFRLVCPFSFESIFSLVPSTDTVPHDIIYSQSPTIHSGIPSLNSTVNPIISETFAPDVTNSVNPLQVVLFVTVLVWLIGIVAMLVYSGVSFIRLNAKVREGVVLKDNIWLCDRIDTPFILGLFRPRIFLPSDMAESDMEYVIAHENAHLRRRDHWWKPLGFILLTVYWFNPVMWIAYILLCRDIELACDEKVIKEMGTDIKKSYSETLINFSVSRRTISACPLAFGEIGVKDRVKSVLSYKKPTLWIIIVAVISCIVVALCFLTNPKGEQNEEITESETDYYGKYTYLEMLDYTVAGEYVSELYDIDAVHYPGNGEGEAAILIGEAHGVDLSKFLSNVKWSRSLPPIEELSSPGSVEFVINDDYRVTVHKRKTGSLFAYAVVKYEDEIRYYHASYDDYEKAVAILHPFDMLTEDHDAVFEVLSYISDFDSAYISLNIYTKTVFFSLSSFSSYFCNGSYIENDEYIIITSDDMIQQYTFRKDGDNLIFVADKSSEVPEYKYTPDGAYAPCIPDGAVFEFNGFETTYIDKTLWDIDNDGIEENCVLGYGPTSGLFTVTFSAYENGNLEYFNIFNSGIDDIQFGWDENGKLVVRGFVHRYGADPIDVYCDIVVKDGNIVLCSNIVLGSGDSLMPYWGEQGVSSMYAPGK